jgi:hypothetical protein
MYNQGFLATDNFGVVTDVNAPTKILYGPYVPVPKGSYMVTLSYETETNEENSVIGSFQVYANQGRKKFTVTEIKSGPSSLTVGPVLFDDDYKDAEFVTFISPDYKNAVKIKSIKVDRMK